MADDDDDDSDKSTEKSSVSTMSTAGGGKGKQAAAGGGSGMGLCLCLVCVLGVCGAGAAAAFLLLNEENGNKTGNASEASSAAASASKPASVSAASVASVPGPKNPPPHPGHRRGTEDAPRLDAYGHFVTDAPPEEDAGQGVAQALKVAAIARQRQHRKPSRRRFRTTSANRAAAQAGQSSKSPQRRSRAEEGDTKLARHVTRRALGAARSLLAKSAAAQKRSSNASGLRPRRPVLSHDMPSSKAAPGRWKHGQGSRRSTGVSTAPSHSAAKAAKNAALASRARTATNAAVLELTKQKVDGAKLVRMDMGRAVPASPTKRTVLSTAIKGTENRISANGAMRSADIKVTPGSSAADSSKNTSSADSVAVSTDGSASKLPPESADSRGGVKINVTGGVLVGLTNETLPSTTFKRTGKIMRASSMRSADVKVAPGSSATDSSRNRSSADSAAISANGTIAKLPLERADSAGGGKISVTDGVLGGLINETVPSTALKGTGNMSANGSLRSAEVKVTPGDSAADASKNTLSADSTVISANGSVAKLPPERADSGKSRGGKINVTRGVIGGLTNGTVPSTAFISPNSSTRSNDVKPGSYASGAVAVTNASAAKLPRGRGESTESGIVNVSSPILRDVTNRTVPSASFKGNGTGISARRSVPAKIKPGSSAGNFSNGASSAVIVKNDFLPKLPDETMDDVEDGTADRLSAGLLRTRNAAGRDGSAFGNHGNEGEAELGWGATDRK